ncbi:matrix-remodeling-associated protein 7-like [Tachysurus fulvidraco]|uniref:matrix-remodeling-associated protein 7-like n=1 Tax=Tachysurus fulvidraco TaxID=1234273 RepID=UPI001FEF8407|nr:matrix-remodeling-associated protein 7-like [Tachysurus fulvidraco]
MDAWFLLLSVAFTTLAGFLTAVLFRRKGVSLKTATRTACTEHEEGASATEAPAGLTEPHPESESKSECTAQMTEELQDEPCTSNQQESVGDQCERDESENDESSHTLSGNRKDNEDQALKYMPGMLRTSQLEKMMSKEELEEEQRVQQEQLAAIFKLLKENQDTFGEVTEKDMEEQLKLYSI